MSATWPPSLRRQEPPARSGQRYVKVNPPNAKKTDPGTTEPPKSEATLKVDPLSFTPGKFAAQRDEVKLAQSILVPKEKTKTTTVAVEPSKQQPEEKIQLLSATTGNVTPRQGKAFEGGQYRNLSEALTKPLDQVSLTAEATGAMLDAYSNKNKVLFVGKFAGQKAVTVGEAAAGMKKLNEALGPVGTAVGVYQWATAENDKDKHDAARDLLLDAALVLTKAPTPVSIGIGVLQLLASTDAVARENLGRAYGSYQDARARNDRKGMDFWGGQIDQYRKQLYPEQFLQPRPATFSPAPK